jgi:hypothetical protein
MRSRHEQAGEVCAGGQETGAVVEEVEVRMKERNDIERRSWHGCKWTRWTHGFQGAGAGAAVEQRAGTHTHTHTHTHTCLKYSTHPGNPVALRTHGMMWQDKA